VGEGAVGSRGNPAAAIKVRVSMAKCAEEIRARALDISLEFTAVSSGVMSRTTIRQASKCVACPYVLDAKSQNRGESKYSTAA